MSAQLAYLVLLPEGPDIELPLGPFRCESVQSQDLFFEGVIDDDGLRFLLPDDREPFESSLNEFCPRWFRVSASGPREEVFAALPTLLAAAFQGSAGGWACDLLTGRLLARPRALALPAAFDPLAHMALVSTHGWAMTRGLTKLGRPELAVRFPPGAIQEAKQLLIELAAIHAERELTPGAAPPFAAGELQVEVPPGVATAKLDSVPSQLLEGCENTQASLLEGAGITSHGVLRVRILAGGEDVTETHLLEHQGGVSSPLHRAEPQRLPETAAEALITVLGDPSQVFGVGAVDGPPSPGSTYTLLQWEQRVSIGEAGPCDLFVSSGFSDLLPPGFEGLVEVGVMTHPDADTRVGELLFFLLRLAHLPEMREEGQFLYPQHSLVCDDALQAAGLDGFHALLFTFPYFLPPDESVLEISWGGGGPQRVFPLLAVPITESEWEHKRAHGYDALCAVLAERFPAGEWLLAGARPAAV